MNGNIITRRLCRNKQMDDNELYRSNSFKFEKFKRNEMISNSNTLPRPVSRFFLKYVHYSVVQ